MDKREPLTLTYNGMYRAKVEQNDETQTPTGDASATPHQWGRIKVRVYPMMASEDIPVDALPWAVPANPLFEGSGVGFGCFTIPKVDSMVWVFFENGDPMLPVYFAEALDGVNGLPTELADAYPDSKVLKTKEGHLFYVDPDNIKVKHSTGHWIVLDQNMVRILHSSGAFLLMEKSGDLKIYGAKDIAMLATNQILINAGREILLDGAVAVKVNSGLLLDFGTDLASWTTSLVGTGAVTQTIMAGLPAYQMLSGATLGSIAGIAKDLPSLTTKFTAQMGLIPTVLGNVSGGNFLSMDIINSTVKSLVRIDDAGVLVKNGLSWSRVVATALAGSALKSFQFLVDQSNPLAPLMDIVKDGSVVASAVPCLGDSGAFTPGIAASLVNAGAPNLQAGIAGLQIFDRV